MAFQMIGSFDRNTPCNQKTSELVAGVFVFLVLLNSPISDRVFQTTIVSIGYVPVDRHEDAMIGSMTISENMMLRSSMQVRK
ncbi:hypothetical protein NQU17_09460 [Clostridiaceae bacterium HFYG-1003]|nr:hypothetical protein NQU17_09460 [Clostridiaceae bacterium HFYG-1003]